MHHYLFGGKSKREGRKNSGPSNELNKFKRVVNSLYKCVIPNMVLPQLFSKPKILQITTIVIVGLAKKIGITIIAIIGFHFFSFYFCE